MRVGICRFSTSSQFSYLLRGRETGLISDRLLTLSSGHLTFASLRTRMKRLDDAKHHVDKAKHILNTSGSAARLSWLSSYCAYRAGDVAMKQGRVSDGM